MKVAFISTFDSFLRANKMLADALAGHGVETRHIILKTRLDQITGGQIQKILGSQPCETTHLDNILPALAQGEYDWVVLSAENSTCRKFFDRCTRWDFPQPRPRIATIYPGIIFRHHYDGFSARMPADLVILNSQKDYEMYAALRQAYGYDTVNAFVFGPVTNIGAENVKRVPDPRLVVFYDQPSVPASKEEKYYIYQQLSLLAGKYPDYDFRVKLRINPKESTLHKGGEQAASILQKSNTSLPPGGRKVEIITGDTREIISRSALSLSVSSTALVESLACGCPAAAISDFGIDEEYGLSYFVGSGMIACIDEINPNSPICPKPEWIKEHMSQRDSATCRLVEYLRGGLLSRRREDCKIYPQMGSKSLMDYMSKKMPRDKVLARVYRGRKTFMFFHKLSHYAIKTVIKGFP